MVFINEQWNNTGDIVVYSNYHKYWLDRERKIKNPLFDVFSGKILDLKEGKQSAINYFYNILNEEICDGVLVVEAERESGTMHTVEYAKQQYRRLACYCNALFAIEKATGNQYIQENSRAQIINDTNDLNIFLNDIAQEPYYEQMSLFD